MNNFPERVATDAEGIFVFFLLRHEVASAGRQELRVTVNFHANPPRRRPSD